MRILAEDFPPSSSAIEFSNEELERDANLDVSRMSNWDLVCQEIIDTEFSPVYYKKCYDELLKRGKTLDEIRKMRDFAWMTAGWLNYARMVWDWVSVDETDIRRAIDWQYEGDIISDEQRRSMLLFLEKHR
ncbi:MAG: hypothetical protein GXP41_11475 [Chloroflexi bacterium]|nr:hypothetical protein [Chloroflexota bacterium]